MKTLSYSQNFYEATRWVDTPEFEGAGSFINENETGTFTAYLNDIIIGRKFRSLGSAMRAMNRAANGGRITKEEIKATVFTKRHGGRNIDYSVTINGDTYSSSRLDGKVYVHDIKTREERGHYWNPLTRKAFIDIVYMDVNGYSNY